MIALFRLGLRLVTVVYLAALAALLALLHWQGDRVVPLSPLLFAPPAVFLAPMLLLGPSALLFSMWRTLLAQFLAAAVLLFGYMTFGWRPANQAPEKPDLTLVTHNIADADRGEVAEFLSARHPDVALLEDAGQFAPDFGKLLPGYHLKVQDQFVCLSRWPILKSRVLKLPRVHEWPEVARFELEIEGKRTAFYSVHLYTPRQSLIPILREGPKGIGSYPKWLEDHRINGEALAGELEKETLPYLVAGDFNMPDHGALYHRFSSFLTDAFAKSGEGWGFSFPGYSHNVLTRGPWLRIDYAWAGRGWRPLSCETSLGRLSKHRAIAASFAREGGSNQ